MLLADDHRAVVLTPTKTGTFSLESSLHGRGFTKTMPRHRRDIPEQWHGARVYLLIRDPYARLVSAFKYGIVHKHSLLLRWGANGFDEFCQHWAAARDTGKSLDWTTLYAEYIDHAKLTNSRVSFFKLETDGVVGLAEHLTKSYPDIPVINRHINRSDKAGVNPLWTAAAIKAVGDRLAPDLELGGYHKPRASRHVPAR